MPLIQRVFCDRYSTEGYLPCGVPLQAFETVACRSYYICSNRDLVLCHGKALVDARLAFTQTVLCSFECIQSQYEVLVEFGMDLFWNLTRGEMGLLRYLLDVPDEKLNARRIGEDLEPEMSDDAYVWVRLQF